MKSVLMGIVDADRIKLRDLKGSGRSAVDIDSLYKPLVFMDFQNDSSLEVELVINAQTKERQQLTLAKVEDLLQHTGIIHAVARGYLAGKTNEAVTGEG